ncbi:heat shock factor 5 [Pelobates cultripes]|uniref:Heat shock factor protein 5 n=1 Tax=Pelobates cultripes TaxID=61616 RepID=A0AAD1VLZ3_PELCU|nr:heat shock factor 5 [Pelobates cultripes]
MEAGDFVPSIPINPNNFPAKLWRLVNSPLYKSICWDSRGEGVLIDQQLFEAELLSASKSMNESNELFKTSNFTSFIRQLNLYGFRKVMLGGGSNTGSFHPGGDLGAGDGQLHYFHNIYFRKDNPDLLVNLKRLTSTNKAKLAAGLTVNSRPPNRFQRLLTSSLEQSKVEEQGPVTLGQIRHPIQQENISPFSASHSHIGFPFKGLDRTPIPPRTWSNPFGLLQGQEPPPHFPEKRILFPILQRFPTEVPCAIPPTATAMHGQQGPNNISGGMQKYGSYASSAVQYPPAYYPTAILQCYPSPAHMEYLASCANPAVPSYQHCGYFQSPSMQSSYPMDFLPPIWPTFDSDESKRDDVNLEDVFQIVDELNSSSKVEIVNVDTLESEAGTLSPSNKNQVPVTLDTKGMGDCCSQVNQLEPLTPVHTDIAAYVTEADPSIAVPVPQASDYVYPIQKEICNRMSSKTNTEESEISIKSEKDDNQSEHALTLIKQEYSSCPLKYLLKYHPPDTQVEEDVTISTEL